MERGYMRKRLGEEGTEQFTVTTRVNEKLIGQHSIHDPFVRTTVTLHGWEYMWRALFGGIKVQVCVDGTHGAQSAIMSLNPTDLQESTEEHLRWCAMSRSDRDANSQISTVN
jgi:hypothetical protein